MCRLLRMWYVLSTSDSIYHYTLNCFPTIAFFFPFPSILILKGLDHHLEMAVLQRGLLYPAAGQAPLENLVRIGQAGCSQAVVDCPQPTECNLGLSPNHLHLVVLQPQEAVAMIRLGALSSCPLAQENGNKECIHL